MAPHTVCEPYRAAAVTCHEHADAMQGPWYACAVVTVENATCRVCRDMGQATFLSVAFSSLPTKGLLISQSAVLSFPRPETDGLWLCHIAGMGWRPTWTAPEIDSSPVKKDFPRLEGFADVLLWLSAARAGVRSVHSISKSTSVPPLNLTTHCLPRSATISTMLGCCSLHTAAPALQCCF